MPERVVDDAGNHVSPPRSGRRQSAASPARTLEVEGCAITWRSWGALDSPALVLVHGARAHGGWWRQTLTPVLLEGRRIVALDLSGNGDSGHRDAYSPRLWGEELAAVIRECAGGRATVVGHSMGGWVAIVCAADHPELVAAAILLNSSVRRPEPGTESEPRGMPERPPRRFRSREEAIASFRLVPEQPVLDPAFVREVAEASLRRQDGGWRWKFDPAIAQRFNDGLVRDYLERVRCPLHLVYGSEDPIVSAQTAADIAAMTGRRVPATVIPGAHHHALLDHPEEVAAALLATGLLPVPPPQPDAQI
jgi:pimeloyl-ACP methyl ester carboxylesterase